MTPSVLAWILAVVASLLATGLFMRIRSVQAECDVLEAELAQQKAEAEALENRLEQRSKQQQKRNAEISELRTKLEKAKKRASDKNRNQHSVASQIHELEEALALEKSNVAEFRAQLRSSGNQPILTKKKTRPGPPTEAKPAVPQIDPAKLAGLKQKLEARSKELKEAISQVKALTEELAPARQAASREKRKRETLDRAYAQLRGELEIRKDELRAQRTELERLRALKVTLTNQSDASPTETNSTPPSISDSPTPERSIQEPPEPE